MSNISDHDIRLDNVALKDFASVEAPDGTTASMNETALKDWNPEKLKHAPAGPQLFPLTYLLGTSRDRQNRFLRFHCIQCLVLFLLWSPFLFAHRPALTSSVEFLLGLVGWLVAMVQAKRRKLFHLPLIGWFAERLT